MSDPWVAADEGRKAPVVQTINAQVAEAGKAAWEGLSTIRAKVDETPTTVVA